jgi:hypothetical protein
MCESHLALLSPQSLAGKPDVEAATAKPQKDGLGCRHLSCKSSAFGHKATSSLLIEKALTMCSLLAGSLLAFVGGTLVKEALAVSGLLFVASSLLLEMALTMCSLLASSLLVFVGGMLVEEALAVSSLLFVASSLLVKIALAGRRLEATALVLPKGVDCPLPILVGLFRKGASPVKNGPPGWFWWQQPGSLLVFTQGATNPIIWGVADPVGSARRRL